MTRCGSCCRIPGPLSGIHHGHYDGLPVLFGLCLRCTRSNARLPTATRQKRLNAAATLAATDTTGRYWTARFPDSGAARLAAALIAYHETTADMLDALGWN